MFLRRMPGSAGSAGGQGGGLRHTAAYGGVGTTPAVMKLKKDGVDVRMDMPTRDELWYSIRNQLCCFCADTRTFQSLSQHWTRGHGINLQDIRDYLELPKGFGFISEGLAKDQSDRGKKYYVPGKMKNKGKPRELSAFGMKSQRDKLAKLTPSFRSNVREQALKARVENNQLRTTQYEIDNPCAICGNIFTRTVTWHATVCSRDCNQQRAVLKARRGPMPERQAERICKNCGLPFKFNKTRLTCSILCREENRSRQAVARKGHHALMKQRQLEMLQSRPKRYCSIEGCGGPFRAKGWCGKHYQQAKAAR